MDHAPSSLDRPTGTWRAAVPRFRGRVSPVLDTCTQLCVLAPEAKAGIAYWTVPLEKVLLPERVLEIQQLEVGLIICGAVSDLFHALLKEAGIQLICGIAGDIGEVIVAFRNGTLDQPRFRMPGSE